MTMKRLCAAALMIVWAFCALAAEKSGTIVYINGSKYYIHTVQPGETLYGLSKTYGVGEKVILENNPSIARGLKTAENIKIPFVSDVPEPKSDKKLRKTFDFHFVSKGETLYAISRQYEIPVKTLLEDNPNLDPLHMRLGERILIRKKQIGSEDEAGTKEQWEEYRQSLNSVAEEGTAYHIVHPGETFYSLSRRFGITEAEFSALNGGLKPADLKAGAMVKIPAPEAGQVPEGADSLQRQDSVPEAGQQVVQIDFRALRAGDPLDVALLLPIAVDGEANGNYLEFYQGFLLGLDSVKLKYGRSVNVNLYNTARDTARIREIVEKVAATDANILITGENGTGKEMLAREIHNRSARSGELMVSVDMGAVPETLFESELFGHVRGAFTDARADRAGKFEVADHGTLFLDEIGNLPPHLQSKLLTAIQGGRIFRVGSNTPVAVDIRLICATNRDLFGMVARGGEFREDLLYRINTIHIDLPPLRQRREDILPLAEMFLKRYATKYNKPIEGFDQAAVREMDEYPWAGNIRELQHTVEKAVIMSDGRRITPATLLLRPAPAAVQALAFSTLEEMERGMIGQAMARYAGNLTEVARQLGITRQTLYNKIKRYGL